LSIRLQMLALMIVSAILFPFDALGFDLASHVTEFRLSNGMRWLVVRREQAPVFSGMVMIRAGGMDEASGKTGLAHMFEHMAFKGTSRIGTKDWAKEKPVLDKIEALGAELTGETVSAKPDAKRIEEIGKEMAALKKEAAKYQSDNEVWEILMRNGGKGINAYTSKDLTAFHASMPSSRLGLWAAVTAEIVFNPAYRDFYTERSVIAEERRSGVDDDPDGAFVEKLLATAFEKGGYSWPTIGSESDVMGFTTADARAFHERNYVPSNMVGVIVGDLDVAGAKAILQREFGRYPARQRPAQPHSKSSNTGGRSASLEFAAAPAIAIAFHKPTLPDPAEYSFDIMATLLCEGSSSRLKKRLVFDERMAKEIFCSDGFPGSRSPNLFMIWIEPLKGKSTGKILDAIEEEIARLRDEPVDEEEMERVRKTVTSAIMFAMDSNETFAEQLAHFETVFDDWRLLGEYPEKISGVTPEDVQSVARKYFVDSNRIILERKRKR